MLKKTLTAAATALPLAALISLAGAGAAYACPAGYVPDVAGNGASTCVVDNTPVPGGGGGTGTVGNGPTVGGGYVPPVNAAPNAPAPLPAYVPPAAPAYVAPAAPAPAYVAPAPVQQAPANAPAAPAVVPVAPAQGSVPGEAAPADTAAAEPAESKADSSPEPQPSMTTMAQPAATPTPTMTASPKAVDTDPASTTEEGAPVLGIVGGSLAALLFAGASYVWFRRTRRLGVENAADPAVSDKQQP